MRRFFKVIMMVVIVVSVPTTMVTMGYALKLLHEALPLLAFAGCCLSLIITVISFAALVDTRREQAGLPPL